MPTAHQAVYLAMMMCRKQALTMRMKRTSQSRTRSTRDPKKMLLEEANRHKINKILIMLEAPQRLASTYLYIIKI